jgi:hypothetical protein
MRSDHYIEDAPNQIDGKVSVKHIAHAIHEDSSGSFPVERELEAVFPKPRGERVRSELRAVLDRGMIEVEDTGFPLGNDGSIAVVTPR